MTVAVQQPNTPAKKDPMDQLQQALGIATSIYGVALERDKLNQLGEQNRLKQQAQKSKDDAVTAEMDRKKAGILNTGEQLAAARSGIKFSELGKPPQLGHVPMGIDEKTGQTLFGIKEINPSEAGKTDFTQSQALFNNYTDESKNTTGMLSNYQTINVSRNKKKPDGAADLATTYAYMKLVDPNSRTVTDSDFRNINYTAGIPDQILAMRNKIVGDGSLSEEQRNKIFAHSDELMKAQLDSQKDVDAKYAGLAHLYKLDKEKILDPRFTKVSNDVEQNILKMQHKNMVDQAHPPVEQDGHKYYWNPSSGKYE